MDSRHWQQIQDVFAAAIDAPADQRDSYLAQACAGNPDLHSEVVSLLRAHTDAASFIEPVPARVGPYRLLKEIGSGGMGSIYLAERDDGQFEHRVAVKLLSLPGRTSLHGRFLAERQILASLSHPHIASLLDGGVTPSGISYIVMEYVEGVPIDQYCRERPLPERLRLFREICSAVHYAHQHLVVHRDLKPANILVTADGIPKLLDFGIAKILAADPGPERSTVAPAMTPDYASPEQVRGAPISTASDIYSLGVLLHELLTGRLPYHLSGRTYEEVVRTVCEQPIEKPGTGSADLDAIIAKAMRKEPPERYSSAEALSSDIDRFVSKRPVDARRGVHWYVFTRFVARNRAAVVAGCAILAMLSAAVVITTRQARIATRRFQDVRQLASATLVQINDAVALLPGSTAARKLIVASALDSLERLASDAGDDRDLQLEIAMAYVRFGNLQGLQSQSNLGDPQGALSSYSKARALFAGILQSHPQAVRPTLGLAEANRNIALVLTFLRRNSEARAACGEAVNLLEALVRRDPSDIHQQVLAGAYSSMADVLGEDDPYRYKSLNLFEKLLAAQPQDPTLQRDVALVHKNLASNLLARSQEEKALPHLMRAEQLDATRAASNPANPETLMDLSFDYSQNGTYYQNRERYEEALSNYQKAVEIRRRLAAVDPADTRPSDRLLFVLSRHGRVLLELKKSAEALASFQEARDIGNRLLAADPKHPQYRANLAIALEGMGKAQAALGNAVEACGAWQAALALFQQLERDGQLRPNERERMEELRKEGAACPSPLAPPRLSRPDSPAPSGRGQKSPQSRHEAQ